MKATLLKTNGEQKEIEITTFKDAQNLVGGLVQIRPLKEDTRKIVIMNEAGRAIGLPDNPFFCATQGNETIFGVYCGDLIIADPKLFFHLPYDDKNI